jgi:hypothetical protein
MRGRVLGAVWVAFGVALWLGVFDLYVSRGAREYGQEHAEYELHLRPFEPSMNAVMSRAKHDGLVAASIWAGVAVGLGWATILLRSNIARARRHSRGSL